jgi:hypothetical protein
MLSLAGLIVPFLLAITYGKHSRTRRKTRYVLVALLAVVQTGLVLLDMYTQKNPLGF